MKSLKIGLSLAALAFGGAAIADHHAGATGHGPKGSESVTRAQMQSHSAQVFDRLDVNKDGKVDQGDREARQAARFDRIDTDRNGQISKAEFMAHRPGHGGRQAQGGGDGPNAAASGQGSGHMGMRRGGRGHGMGRMLLRTADANKDGAVTRDEFSAAAGQHFDHMDANKDGQVTHEERRAMHQSMRQQVHGHKGHGKAGHGAHAPQGN